MNRKFSLAALAFLTSFAAFAGVKVTSLGLKTEGATGFVNVTLDGRSKDLPDIRVYGRTIEVTFTGAEPFAAIYKTVNGAQLSANVLNGKAVVKAILPYEINSEKVNLGGTNSDIEVEFPRGKASPMTVAAPEAKAPVIAAAPKPVNNGTISKLSVSAIETKPTSKVVKEALNEDYLNKLMNEDTKKPVDTAKNVDEKKDEINVKQAAPAVNQAETSAAPKPAAGVPTKVTENFSFAGYAVKFSVFLALVLGLFYGVVQLLKKGVFNRGKLGFLNNTQMIEVLSTTYIAPKKSLMIVKAHKQLFLVANSETGLQFLAEMKDTSGIIKEGEKQVSGTNFDLNLSSLVNSEGAPIFNLKEDINESTPVSDKPESSLSKIAMAKDIVKFSDELKKKAKKLKPIEFN